MLDKVLDITATYLDKLKLEGVGFRESVFFLKW